MYQTIEDIGKVCTVHEVAQGRKFIVLAANPPRPKDMSAAILEVLEEWRSIWTWSSLQLIGDNHWLEEAIEAGTCVAVTDGSYICEVFSDVCSAAFILE